MVTEAQIRANQQNAQKSTGPKTTEGKLRSRANGLKHGLSGQGVVVPEDVAAEVEHRYTALHAELSPGSTLGSILVGQIAFLSVRMERAATLELANTTHRVRLASKQFDAERVEEAEALIRGLGDDPRENLRRLHESPVGVEQMLQHWREMRADLTHPQKPIWSMDNQIKMARLTGHRGRELRGTRVDALSRAARAEFHWISETDGAGLTPEARQVWARGEVLIMIDAEIARLEAHYDTVDFEAIEQERALAETRALFDPSKEAARIRRYEEEARRGFFRSLREFRKVEQEAARRVVETDEPASEPAEPLASCREDNAPESEAPQEKAPTRFNPPSWPASRAYPGQPEIAPAANGLASSPGRGVKVPA